MQFNIINIFYSFDERLYGVNVYDSLSKISFNVGRTRVKIAHALNVLKASKLVQMKLVT